MLAYGLLNAALYASLLPLWEGFDEEFHYGYVQYLSAHHQFPVLGKTGLSQEVNRSIELLPMSYVMIVNLRLKGLPLTFDQYFALYSATRHQLFGAALAIPTDLRSTESSIFSPNYEVHHAPLAYLSMAIFDSFLHRAPLPRRVWVLRLMVSIAATVLMFRGLLALGSEAELSDALAATLVFLMFSCQMFWATIAHIGNDWLAVPLAVWLIVLALRFQRSPSNRLAFWLAVVLGLGLTQSAHAVWQYSPPYRVFSQARGIYGISCYTRI